VLLDTTPVQVGSRIRFSVGWREGVVIDVPGDSPFGGVAPGHIRVELDDGSRVDVPGDAIIDLLD